MEFGFEIRYSLLRKNVVADASSRPQLGVMDDIDFGEDLLDRNDAPVRTITTKAKNTDNSMPHSENTTTTNVLQERKVVVLGQEVSKRANIPKEKCYIDEYGMLTGQ